MYPKLVKLNSSGKEYLYSPEFHEHEFKVYLLDDPKIWYLFIFDPTNHSFQIKNNNDSENLNELGKAIFANEYLNFRG